MEQKQSFSVTFGMHVAKGTQVAIGKGGLIIRANGQSPTVVFKTRLSVAWQWFEIAIINLESCKAAQIEFIRDLECNAPGKVDDPLWRTCAYGMQATIAVAFALDGIYAEVKEQFPLPNDLTSKWKKKKTARYAQIAETFRRTFRFTGEDAKLVREMLKSIFNLRDLAVHPPAHFASPIAFGDVEVLVDQTFAAFEYTKVWKIVESGVNLVKLIGNTRSPDDSVRTFASGSLKLMNETLRKWDQLIEKSSDNALVRKNG